MFLLLPGVIFIKPYGNAARTLFMLLIIISLLTIHVFIAGCIMSFLQTVYLLSANVHIQKLTSKLTLSNIQCVPNIMLPSSNRD